MTTPASTLRNLFEERSVTAPLSPGRALAVHRRVTRLRRRRRAAATVAAAVVAVALAVPLGLTDLTRTDREVPAWEQTTDGLLNPLYLDYWRGQWGESARPLLWSHAMHLILEAAVATHALLAPGVPS